MTVHYFQGRNPLAPGPNNQTTRDSQCKYRIQHPQKRQLASTLNVAQMSDEMVHDEKTWWRDVFNREMQHELHTGKPYSANLDQFDASSKPSGCGAIGHSEPFSFHWTFHSCKLTGKISTRRAGPGASQLLALARRSLGHIFRTAAVAFEYLWIYGTVVELGERWWNLYGTVWYCYYSMSVKTCMALQVSGSLWVVKGTAKQKRWACHRFLHSRAFLRLLKKRDIHGAEKCLQNVSQYAPVDLRTRKLLGIALHCLAFLLEFPSQAASSGPWLNKNAEDSKVA